MKESITGILLVSLSLLGTICPQAHGDGMLDAFEAAVAGGSTHHSRHSDFFENWLSYSLADAFAEISLIAILYGGASSWERVSEPDSLDLGTTAREIGDPLIPLARIDIAYQDLESDIEALDLRCELGYGPFGAHFDYTQCRGDPASDELELMRAMGLWRMSLGSHLELDLGMGVLEVKGDQRRSEFLISLPILYHPFEHWGVEFRPAWTDRVDDYDIALLVNQNFVSLKLGYRWVESSSESLHGPYAGISLRF